MLFNLLRVAYERHGSVNSKCSLRNRRRFFRDWSKSVVGGREVGRSREGVGHQVLSLVQGVGRAIFRYP